MFLMYNGEYRVRLYEYNTVFAKCGAPTLTHIPERPQGAEWWCAELLMGCHVKGNAGYMRVIAMMTPC